MTVLKELFGSKKFLASLAGIITVLVATLLKFDIPDETLMAILGVIGTFVLGQGIADHGKEANKIAAGVTGAEAPKVDP